MLEQFKQQQGLDTKNQSHSMIMHVNVRELIYGHQSLLETSTNNNKYLNMLTFQTETNDDPDAYIISEEQKNSQ